MARHVLDLRDNVTAYDTTYVVLARSLEAPLVTADAKLAEARRFSVDLRIVQPPEQALARSMAAGLPLATNRVVALRPHRYGAVS